MSAPVAQTQASHEDQITAAILVVLLADLPLPDTEAQITILLERLGISPQPAADAVNLIVPQIEAASRAPLVAAPARIERLPAAPTSDGGIAAPTLRLIPAEPRTPAQSHVRTTEVPRHSRYLAAAAKRFQLAQSQAEGQAVMQKERRYLAQHLNAVRYSREAAQRVDNAVQRYGTTALGWWAHLDSRTTPECRAAHGSNFSATRPPIIGYPGTLHGGTCRCHAGAAHKTARTVDQATAHLRSGHVIPFATELSDA